MPFPMSQTISANQSDTRTKTAEDQQISLGIEDDEADLATMERLIEIRVSAGRASGLGQFTEGLA